MLRKRHRISLPTGDYREASACIKHAMYLSTSLNHQFSLVAHNVTEGKGHPFKIIHSPKASIGSSILQWLLITKSGLCTCDETRFFQHLRVIAGNCGHIRNGHIVALEHLDPWRPTAKNS